MSPSSKQTRARSYPGLLLYRCLLWLALPVVLLRLWWRGRNDPAYKPRWRERFGVYPQPITPNSIWFHTVSAGESIAAAPLIRELAQRGELRSPLLVTTMTPTGSEQVTRLLGDCVQHCYAPYDFTFAVGRFLAHVQPRALILMETEIWPNLILQAKALGIPVVLMNARLSAKSARGYERFDWLGRPVLQAIDLIACQTEEHVERFQALGVAAERLQVVGNVKYDLDAPIDLAQRAAQIQARLGGEQQHSWIAASTHPGEEELVLLAHQQLLQTHEHLLLWLAPRHPNRLAELTPLLDRLAQRMPGGWCRYTELVDQHADNVSQVSVVLVDQMGVLMPLYQLADVAFMGGSLIDHGGHNPIEPASLGTPVMTGAHHFNFAQVFADLMQAGACITTDEDILADDVGQLLVDVEQRTVMGAAGAQVVQMNRGAKQRSVALVEQQLSAD
jgi:3-deoxy-D-manno-octulosonic-acid transferase